MTTPHHETNTIFIAREDEIHLFQNTLQHWLHNLPPATDRVILTGAPSPEQKLSGFIALLYGSGGYGKTTLLHRYQTIAQNTSVLCTVSAVVNWEFVLDEGARTLFRSGTSSEPDAEVYFDLLHVTLAIYAFHRSPEEFKHYIRAVKAVKRAADEARIVLKHLLQDERYKAAKVLLGEGGIELLRQVPILGGVLSKGPLAEAARTTLDEATDLSVEVVAYAYTKLRDALKDRFDDYLHPALRLGLALGQDLAHFAKQQPLLLFFDTYEEIDESDHLLRIVMRSAGPRVGWVIAGRDNLWAGWELRSRNRGAKTYYGYKDIILPEYRIAIDLSARGTGIFTPEDIRHYFHLLRQQKRHLALLPPLNEQHIQAISDETLGVPLAIRLASGIYEETGKLDIITQKQEGHLSIIHKMVDRYLIHVHDNEQERAQLYALAMLRRADHAPSVVAALGLSVEQRTQYEAMLLNLHRRYSFIFTETANGIFPSLHQEVRDFVRWDLREHQGEPHLTCINLRLQSAHETALKELEARRGYTTLRAHLEDHDWVATYMDWVEQECWLHPSDGVCALLPFMITTAIYQPTVTSIATALGTFFETRMKPPYSLWWQWAKHCFSFESNTSSHEVILALHHLDDLLHQRYPSFAHPFSENYKEIEACLWWRQGEVYQNKGEHAALIYFEKASTILNEDKKFRDAFAQCCVDIAHTYFHEDRHEEVFELATKAIELKPDFADAYFYKATTYSAKGQYEQAIQAYTDTLERNGNISRVYLNKAYLHFEREKYEQVIQDITLYLKIDDSDSDAYNLRGVSYMARNEYDLAIADFNHALQLSPDDQIIYYNRALAYLGKKEYERAIQDFEVSLKMDPSHEETSEYLDIAYEWQRNEQIIQSCTHDLELDSNNSEIYFTRGFAYKGLNNFDLALKDFTQVIQLDSGNPHAWSQRGDTFRMIGNYEQAIQDQNQALALDINDCCALSSQAMIYMERQEYSNAINNFDRILALEPDDLDLLDRRSKAYSYLGEYQRAIDDRTHMLDLNPDSASSIYFNRGYLYLWLGNVEQAYSDFVKSAELDPSDVYTAWMTIFTSFNKRRPQRNFAEKLEAISLIDIQSSTAYLCRGVALGLRGELEEALREIKQALLENPDSKDALFWQGMVCLFGPQYSIYCSYSTSP